MLLQISKIWRYRVVTLPVLALTLLGAFYVVAIKAPVYGLVQLRADQSSAPADGGGYRRRSDAGTHQSRQSVHPLHGPVGGRQPLVQQLEQRVGAPGIVEGRARIPVTQWRPTGTFGYSSLVVEVTGVGSTPQTAVQTAEAGGRCAD